MNRLYFRVLLKHASCGLLYVEEKHGVMSAARSQLGEINEPIDKLRESEAAP